MAESLEDKVAKLLRLAQNEGATEAEATAAMEAAQRLAFKHGLELAYINLDEDANDHVMAIGGEFIRVEGSGQWKRILLNTIIKGMGGRGVWMADSGGKHSGQMHVFAPQGTHTAIFQTYRMIENWIEVESKFAASVREETWVHGRTWRNSWIQGAVNRICARLREVKRAQAGEIREAGNGMALARMDADVNHAVSDVYPHLRSMQRSTARLHGGAYSDGQRAGNSANIGMTNLPGGRRQLKG
jgi:hypothetical protein